MAINFIHPNIIRQPDATNKFSQCLVSVILTRRRIERDCLMGYVPISSGRYVTLKSSRLIVDTENSLFSVFLDGFTRKLLDVTQFFKCQFKTLRSSLGS